MLDLDMTPYAAFIWPAWGVSALVLAALTGRAVIASRKWKRELEGLEPDQRATPDAAASLRPRAARSAIGQKK